MKALNVIVVACVIIFIFYDDGQVFVVTAYCPCARCCGVYSDGLTASGKPAVGLIVAAPKNIPFGTVIDIPGYGRAVVEDRGSAIKGDKIDVLFPTHQEALDWGVKKLKCRIIRSL